MRFKILKLASLFSVLMVLALLASTLTPAHAVNGDQSAATPPTLFYPRATIVEGDPVYRWSKVENATRYYLQINLGNTTIYNKDFDSSGVCTGAVCTKHPAKSLNYNAYKWRVGALVSGNVTWSTYKNFIVSPDTYENCFASGKTGWVSLSGAWSTYEKMLISNGTANKISSIYYGEGQYGDFTYEAIVKREGSAESFLGVRMGTGKVAGSYAWYPGYLFGFRNSGEFAIFYMDAAGARQVIQNWTVSSAIKANDWNTLKVTAKGSNFQFFINNVPVRSFKDTRRARGYNGFTFTSNSRFSVDWMKVTVIAAE